MRELKLLCREYRENKVLLNRLKNQLHAKLHAHKVPSGIIRRLKKKISLVDLI